MAVQLNCSGATVDEAVTKVFGRAGMTLERRTRLDGGYERYRVKRS